MSDSTKRQIRDLRDAMEHLDKDIVKGILPEEADVAVALGLNSAALAGFELQYRDLANWLEALHRFAVPLSRVELIVSTPAPPSPAPDA